MKILVVVAIRDMRFVSAEVRKMVSHQLNLDVSESVLRGRLTTEKQDDALAVSSCSPKGKKVNIPLRGIGVF